MENIDVFKVVQRWAYFNSAMTGMVCGYILGRTSGALLGLLLSVMFNYGILASAKITYKLSKDVAKEFDKKIKEMK